VKRGTWKLTLNEKLGIAYPITPGLKWLLETTLTDRRWDMTYLGMQILIEGLALAAFQRIRDYAKNRLAVSVNAYVMQDEARHVAFGRLALRDLYPQLSEAERNEREEFVVEACYHMRDRFNQRELWENLGLPVEQAVEVAMASENMRLFRRRLFSRIVPTVKDIGLWGKGVEQAFADMGAIEFAEVDSEACSSRTIASPQSSTPVTSSASRWRRRRRIGTPHHARRG
jgi:P-aminobenzoate N-oxygenase AurF